MKIEAPQENKIVVVLTREDMSELDITYEEMDYGNIETRRVIWTLLDRARETLRRDIDPSGKMLIETVPTEDGGCVLYFTVLPQEAALNGRGAVRIHKERTGFTYAFASLDALLECAVHLRGIRPLPKSSLYLLDGTYCLRVQAEHAPRRIRQMLSEYGVPCADGVMPAAFLREHARLLARDDAIEKLTIGL